jgi:pancreatic triacylglycerol lipase
LGYHLRRDFGLELGRISGLDPAQPHFERTHPMMRLDPSDAYYVDVIHTNANPILSGGLGVWQPCGHLDFYPNGGRSMAGCNKGIALALQEVRRLHFLGL